MCIRSRATHLRIILTLGGIGALKANTGLCGATGELFACTVPPFCLNNERGKWEKMRMFCAAFNVKFKCLPNAASSMEGATAGMGGVAAKLIQAGGICMAFLVARHKKEI